MACILWLFLFSLPICKIKCQHNKADFPKDSKIVQLPPRPSSPQNASIPTQLPSAVGVATSMPHQECITYDGAYLTTSSLIFSFSVSDLQSCWRYCRHDKQCFIFTFQVISRNCSLHRMALPEYGVKPKRNLAIGSLDCLDCLEHDVDRVVERSKAGILIQNYNKKCLAASDDKVTVDNSEVSKLNWGKCSQENLWIIYWTNNEQIGTNIGSVQIYKLNSTWGLDWKLTNKSQLYQVYEVYLTKKQKKAKNNIILKKSTLFEEEPCKFSIEGIKDGTPSYLNFGLELRYFLNGITFSVLKNYTCPFNQFLVKNGVIVSSDKLPYFLPDSTVTIRCHPGYGIKELNFTTYQDVKCSKNRRPKPCSRIKQVVDERETNTVYLGLALTPLTLITLFLVAYILQKAFCKIPNIDRCAETDMTQETA